LIVYSKIYRKGVILTAMISKKIILIGDFSTGKTSLIRRFVDNQFSDSYLSTIGVKISRKVIPLEHETIQGLIWDIEGGTDKKPVNQTYLKGAHGCILVADINRSDTIAKLSSYIDIIRKITPSAPFILALNKADCFDEAYRQKIYQDTLARYEEMSVSLYLTSAKTGEGVESMFKEIAQRMIDKG
jgi:small GTP-binding protein